MSYSGAIASNFKWDQKMSDLKSRFLLVNQSIHVYNVDD